MDDKFTYDVSEEGDQEAEDVDNDGGKVNLRKHFCQQWRESTMKENAS